MIEFHNLETVERMESMADIKVGVIGCGSVAMEAHIPGYQKVPGVEIAALCDIDFARAKKATERFGVGHVYSDYKEMFAKHGLDIVSVATPPSAHAEATIAALEAGVHVLCEKPMAMNPAEAERMIAAARKAGKLLTIGQDFRCWEGSRLLKRMIDRGDLGHVYYGRAVCSGKTVLHGRDILLRREYAGGGILFCTAVHPIDLVYWLMGSPDAETVSAMTYQRAHRMKKPPLVWNRSAAEMDVEDFVSGLVRFRNGAAMMVEAYWFSDREQQAPFVELKGDRGTAVFDRGTSSLEVWAENEEGEIVDVSPEGLPTFDDTALVGVEIAEFIEAVRTGGQPHVSAREALNVQRILNGINESGAIGKEIEIR